MNFLNPAAIAIAAGLTVPPLVALYFLKLNRQVRFVPSTLLWKKTIEDLRVNAPFQRLRNSLLLWLQLLVLLAGAFALGKPISKMTQIQDDTVIILVDQSASMAVIEADGRSRLAIAKEEARRVIDNMSDDARAMVIAFSDTAAPVSSFDRDKTALKRKIDSIEQTQSTTALGEAIRLAEAYAQTLLLGSEEGRQSATPETPPPPAAVFLMTDGRIADSDTIALQKIDAESMRVSIVGQRRDNVGITAMSARRRYEQPQTLEVVATVQNFSTEARSIDASLFIDGKLVDVKTVDLKPVAVANETNGRSEPEQGKSSATSTADANAGTDARSATADGVVARDSIRGVEFDPFDFEGGGVIEVVLQIDDALPTDNRAWSIIDEPRRVRVLLVSEGNSVFQPLHELLSVMPIDLTVLTPKEYETVDDAKLRDGPRSVFDVVILDRHSTARLPLGNYLFWGSIPKIANVSSRGTMEDEAIFNWDETHPVLRHVSVESIHIFEAQRLELPSDARILVDGHESKVLSYFARDGSQFLVCSFAPIGENAAGKPILNTDWVSSVDFIVFMHNAVEFLSSNVETSSRRAVAPGEPIAMPLWKPAESVDIVRPDGTRDSVAVSGGNAVHYARTRDVGVYAIESGSDSPRRFAVNLFNASESDIAPAASLRLGTDRATTQTGKIETKRPMWPWFLLAALGVLTLEWIVYNQRVFI